MIFLSWNSERLSPFFIPHHSHISNRGVSTSYLVFAFRYRFNALLRSVEGSIPPRGTIFYHNKRCRYNSNMTWKLKNFQSCFFISISHCFTMAPFIYDCLVLLALLRYLGSNFACAKLVTPYIGRIFGISRFKSKVMQISPFFQSN